MKLQNTFIVLTAAATLVACGPESEVTITVTPPDNTVVPARDADGTPKTHEMISQFLASAVAYDSKGLPVTDIRTNVPAILPLGDNTITFTAVSNGVSGEATATISINDLTPPVLALNGSAALTVVAGSVFSDPGYMAIDNVDGDLSNQVEVTGSVNMSREGMYTLAYQVTDSAGNSSTLLNRIINVQMADAPLVSAPSAITVAAVDANGAPASTAAIQAFLNAATAVDKKDGSIATVSNNAPTVFPMGQTTVTFTAVDSDKFTGRSSSYVNVVDLTAPAISLQGDSVVQLTVGNTFADAGVIVNDNVDGDLSANVVVTGSVDTSKAGTYELVYSVADAAGNSSQTSRTVIVGSVEDDAPVISLNGDAVVHVALNQPFEDPGYVVTDDLDSDIAENVEVSGEVDTSVAGVYLITYRVTDSAGNEAEVVRTVYVDMEADVTAPVISLNGESALIVELGQAYVDQGATALDDVDGDLTESIVTTGSVDTSVKGEYTITYTVSDAAGNEAEAVRTVYVDMDADVTAPVLALNGESAVTVKLGQDYVEQGATALDDVDGDLTESIVITGSVDTSVKGEYDVTYTVSDTAGNKAELVRTVSVVADADVTAPVISLNGAASIEVEVGEYYVDLGATALDDVDGDLTDSIVASGTVDTSTKGEYTITYTVSDVAGNEATKTRTVIVVDPVIVNTGMEIYAKKPAGWSALNAHYWNVKPAGALADTAWPGVAMTPLADDWYLIRLPFASSAEIIFNDGVRQTDDLSRTGSGCFENSTWKDLADCSIPPAPMTIEPSPAGADFLTETQKITLAYYGAPENAVAKYTLDGSDPATNGVVFQNGKQITIGEDMAFGDVKTLRILVGEVEESFDYRKLDPNDGLEIFILKGSSWGAVNAHIFNVLPAGTVADTKWPGTALTELSGGWFRVFIPGAESASFVFNSNGAQTDDLTRVGSGCYEVDANVWTDTCPIPMGVSVNPGSKNFEGDSVSLTLNAWGKDLTEMLYSFGTVDPVVDGQSFVSGQTLVVGSDLAIDESVTLNLYVSDGVDSVEESYTYKKIPAPDAGDFSWDNATVYFVLTDRFLDGDSSNNNSYGRERDRNGNIYAGYQDREATFHGGDLKGLTQKLNEGYFNDLGVTAIWITSPLEQIHGFVGGENFKHYAYHGYYHLDFSEIDQNMGTEDDLRTFIDTAHANGIRVVFDIVMNHAGYETLGDMDQLGFGALNAGWDSYYFNSNDTAIHYETYVNYLNTDASKQAEWANWWGGDWIRKGESAGEFPGYDACGGGSVEMCLAGLPDFKTGSTKEVSLPPVLTNKWGPIVTDIKRAELDAFFNETGLPRTVSNHLIAWISQWVREYGVDGFRVDTAKHVELAVWKELKTQAAAAYEEWKDANPTKWADNQDLPFWMTGEVWGHGVGKSDYFNYGFDSIINFGFMGAAGDLSGIDAVYSDYAARINSDDSFNALSYIASHDVGVASPLGGKTLPHRDNLIDAGTALLLVPGAAQIYYGDEIGRLGDDHFHWDQPTRSDMNWDSINQPVLDHWQKLGQFRANHMAVGKGSHRKISDAPYTFARELSNDAVVVALMVAGSNVSIDVDGVFADGETVRDAYSDQTAVVTGGQVSLTGISAPGVILLERVIQ